MFYENLKKLYEEFIEKTDMKEEYAYRVGQVIDHYSSVDSDSLNLIKNIMTILMYSGSENLKTRALIDYLYFVAEEDLSFDELNEEESFVIAYSLATFAKTASEEKRSLWISKEFIRSLIPLSRDLEDVVDNVLEFQKRTIRKRTADEVRDTIEDTVFLSDVEIEEEAKKFIELKRGLSLVREKNGKNN